MAPIASLVLMIGWSELRRFFFSFTLCSSIVATCVMLLSAVAFFVIGSGSSLFDCLVLPVCSSFVLLHHFILALVNKLLLRTALTSLATLLTFMLSSRLVRILCFLASLALWFVDQLLFFMMLSLPMLTFSLLSFLSLRMLYFLTLPCTALWTILWLFSTLHWPRLFATTILDLLLLICSSGSIMLLLSIDITFLAVDPLGRIRLLLCCCIRCFLLILFLLSALRSTVWLFQLAQSCSCTVWSLLILMGLSLLHFSCWCIFWHITYFCIRSIKPQDVVVSDVILNY